MGNKTKGYIYLHKTLLDNPLWTSGEAFNLRDAWVDLLLRANYEDSEAMSRSGDVLTVRRGQILTSQAKLAERWGWSKSKVHRVLRNLKMADMLDFEYVQWGRGGTLITLRNYSYYQAPDAFTASERNTGETQKTRKSQKSGTQPETQPETQVTTLRRWNSNDNGKSAKAKRNTNETRAKHGRNANDNHLNEYNEFYNEINEEGELIEWEE